MCTTLNSLKTYTCKQVLEPRDTNEALFPHQCVCRGSGHISANLDIVSFSFQSLIISLVCLYFFNRFKLKQQNEWIFPGQEEMLGSNIFNILLAVLPSLLKTVVHVSEKHIAVAFERFPLSVLGSVKQLTPNSLTLVMSSNKKHKNA